MKYTDPNRLMTLWSPEVSCDETVGELKKQLDFQAAILTKAIDLIKDLYPYGPTRILDQVDTFFADIKPDISST